MSRLILKISWSVILCVMSGCSKQGPKVYNYCDVELPPRVAPGVEEYYLINWRAHSHEQEFRWDEVVVVTRTGEQWLVEMWKRKTNEPENWYIPEWSGGPPMRQPLKGPNLGQALHEICEYDGWVPGYYEDQRSTPQSCRQPQLSWLRRCSEP